MKSKGPSVLYLLTFLVAVRAAERPTVTSRTGQVVGTTEKSFSGRDYFAFRRIPYAEPPLGELRFRPPVDKEPWEGVLDGTVDGPACIQLNQFNESIVVGSEDCLTLNVYTTQLPETGSNRLKPVLVYIHGGRWLVGTANSKFYAPFYLIDQDIVVVNIQYRLGAFGFLSTKDSVAPGNYGLLDQVKALEWIQANIAAFGGDPNRVTVSGQSAGGASTHMHLFSPLSKGLVHGGIALSGCAINYWANRIDDHDRYAKVQAKAVGCPAEPSAAMIDCLRKVDAHELTLTQPLLHDFFGATPSKLPLAPYGPRVDSESDRPFMPLTALEMIRNGDVDSVPLILGVTSQEGAWLMASFYGQESGERLNTFQENLPRALKSMTGNFLSEEKVEKLRKFYLDEIPITDPSRMIPMSEFMSDLKFNLEIFMAAYFHARQSHAPVYVSLFKYRGLWTFAHEFEETKHDYGGVAHVDDLRYLFKLVYGPELSAEEVEVMQRYTGFVGEFVKHGQPTHGNSSKHYNYYWRNYQKENGQYMIVDVPIKSGMSRERPFDSVEGSRPGRMQLWREIFEYPEDLMEDFPAATEHDEL